jgi:hypothetical protein
MYAKGVLLRVCAPIVGVRVGLDLACFLPLTPGPVASGGSTYIGSHWSGMLPSDPRAAHTLAT